MAGGEQDHTKQRVLAALARPENAICADCSAPSPKYAGASVATLVYCVVAAALVFSQLDLTVRSFVFARAGGRP